MTTHPPCGTMLTHSTGPMQPTFHHHHHLHTCKPPTLPMPSIEDNSPAARHHADALHRLDAPGLAVQQRGHQRSPHLVQRQRALHGKAVRQRRPPDALRGRRWVEVEVWVGGWRWRCEWMGGWCGCGVGWVGGGEDGGG